MRISRWWSEFPARYIAENGDCVVAGLVPATPVFKYLRMPLTLTTWNINSVRLRIDLVARFIKAVRPDVICLQETKCPDDAFPLKRFHRLGYVHAALNGQ